MDDMELAYIKAETTRAIHAAIELRRTTTQGDQDGIRGRKNCLKLPLNSTCLIARTKLPRTGPWTDPQSPDQKTIADSQNIMARLRTTGATLIFSEPPRV